MDAEVDVTPESLFRPVKRRKFVRRRPGDHTEDAGPAGESATERSEKNRHVSESQSTPDGDEDLEAIGVVRLRRPHHARKGGIGFSATSRLGKDDSCQRALGLAEDRDRERERVQEMGDRFTAHTGQTVDVDKHMYGSSYHLAVRCWGDAD